jgi:hypothetical protein
MRENRPYGSEGGGALNKPSLPLSQTETQAAQRTLSRIQLNTEN